ncbi:MAG: methionine gamma-lyase family protein [Defluviitaleaceae bacterium]|nr:methionine gamma-lyase family protein [Defluviitaleaceae bacterium]
MNYLSEHFKIKQSILDMAERAEIELLSSAEARETDKIAAHNQYKVISAMQRVGLSSGHFAASTGYGYGDMGRQALEAVYADVFAAEAALVRPQMVSGTHAISTSLFACLRPGDELLSVTGTPYDTLLGVIGVNPTRGSLIENGIIYNEVSLDENGKPNEAAIRAAISPKTKVAAIQRSRGYSLRPSLTVDEVNDLVNFIKGINRDIICFVDNCYGEFVDYEEPTADLLAGSLIKNPGGGLAPTGGYIVGKEELVHAAANRLIAPGAGLETGPSLGLAPVLLQGIFLAPHVVAASLKGALFAAKMFGLLGVEHFPKFTEKRGCIVQAAVLGAPDALEAFCLGIQSASAVDSFVTPLAWDMPGYDCKVVMAAGGFVQGSSIELSADAPLREPYAVYFQGGLNYDHAKLGVLCAVDRLYSSFKVGFQPELL